MAATERPRLLLDANMSSHGLVRMLEEAGHDVVAAGFRDDLKQLDDDILFNFAQQERRVIVTHNTRDFPEILVAWAHAGRSHHGCILLHISTNAFSELNAFGEMKRRFELWFQQFPAPDDWLDRAVYL